MNSYSQDPYDIAGKTEHTLGYLESFSWQTIEIELNHSLGKRGISERPVRLREGQGCGHSWVEDRHKSHQGSSLLLLISVTLSVLASFTQTSIFHMATPSLRAAPTLHLAAVLCRK